MYVCHVCAGVLRGQDVMLASVDLQLEVTEPPDEVLGSELRSSGRLASALHLGIDSFVPS